MQQLQDAPVNKLATGIAGFDFIAQGGIPQGATTLVSGTPGSAKTVLAAQFLAEGIRQRNESGVFVTFEERPEQIRRHTAGFGWPIRQWENEGKWAFVDASPRAGEQIVEVGRYNFSGLIARIEHAVKKVGAVRVSLDSVSAVFTQFADQGAVRRELFCVAEALRDMGATSIVTGERKDDDSEIARYGVEEFVADNVVLLRNTLDDEHRRRTVEILKFRGTSHHKGEFPFTVSANGIVIIPLSEMKLVQGSTVKRVSSGEVELDEMCGGGFYRDSVILVTGATGCGKTLVTTEFVSGGADFDEKTLVFAFEESHDQLMRNAAGWGVDYAQLEKAGKLRLVCSYPESQSLEDHLLSMKQIITEFKPDRIVVDSLSALERIASTKGFREFVVALTCQVKEYQTASMFTLATPTLLGGVSATENHISSIADTIILLRYVEMFGEMRRGITVLKMRGSQHDKEIREYTIDSEGMHIGKAFRRVTGILVGRPQYSNTVDDRIDEVM